MSADLDNNTKAKELFDALANAGIIHDNFTKREWGCFGRCTDQFGINWMINANS